MIKHIVIWRLKEHAEGQDRNTNARQIKEQLKALRGVIPGLVKLEVGLELDNPHAEQGHVVLYSVFENRVSLQTYASHPQHKKVAAFIKAVAEERRCVDYEMFATTGGYEHTGRPPL
jgi:quinol monooxygenase YgiN